MVQSRSRGLTKDQQLIQEAGEQLQDELGRALSTTVVVFYYKGIQMSDIFVPVRMRISEQDLGEMCPLLCSRSHICGCGKG